jgi:hypothetical protein
MIMTAFVTMAVIVILATSRHAVILISTAWPDMLNRVRHDAK